MGTATLTTRMMTVEEYLRTPFRPDVDFVDGVIEERNLGEFDHGMLQAALLRLFEDREIEWNIRVTPEYRLRISENCVRVPDVCITSADGEVQQVAERAPLLCIEVLSPEDRLARMLERVKDYHSMGVNDAWIFDPKRHKVWVSRMDGVQQWSGGPLMVAGTRIEFDPDAAFERMMRRR